MKALYKGISYLIHQEAEIRQMGSDIEVLLSSMKQLMTNYLLTQVFNVNWELVEDSID